MRPRAAIVAALLLAGGRVASANGWEDRGPLPSEQLARMGVPSDATTLVAVLLEGKFGPRVRSLAARQLSLVGGAEAVRAVTHAAAKDESAEVRRSAAMACGRLRVAEAVGALASLLDEREPLSRATAAWALGRAGGPGAARALAAKLAPGREGSADVRAMLAFALAEAGAAEIAAPALVAALDDPVPEVRLEAAEGLATAYKDARACPVLIGFVRDPATPDWMLDHATRALEAFSGERFGWVKRYGGVGGAEERAAACRAWTHWWERNRDRLMKGA